MLLIQIHSQNAYFPGDMADTPSNTCSIIPSPAEIATCGVYQKNRPGTHCATDSNADGMCFGSGISASTANSAENKRAHTRHRNTDNKEAPQTV